MRACLPLALLLQFSLAAGGAAQSSVVGVRDLNFGSVIRGVQTSVVPTDPIRSGRFYVRHVLNGKVQLKFTLPNNLFSLGSGGNLPIRFGTTDAVAQGTAPGSVPLVFDPNQNETYTLTGSVDFYINLGGQVSPRANQAPGDYKNTLTLTCTFF